MENQYGHVHGYTPAVFVCLQVQGPSSYLFLFQLCGVLIFYLYFPLCNGLRTLYGEIIGHVILKRQMNMSIPYNQEADLKQHTYIVAQV